MKAVSVKLFLTLLLCFVLAKINAQIKVACIGDSITEGAGIKEKNDKYPKQLELMLGQGYEVKNFGKSGATLLNNAKPAKELVDQAVEYKPAIVIIMLGTNDTREEYWKKAHKDPLLREQTFLNDYQLLIERFQAIPETQQIYICYPIRSFDNGFDISDLALKHNVIPNIKLVGRKTGVDIIDLYSPFYDKPALLPDGVHPNADGAKLIATEIFEVLSK